MKKLVISMLAMLAIVSCSKMQEAAISVGSADDLTFKATFEGNDSRVSISEDGDGFKMAWSDDDEIAVYTRINKTKYAYNPDTQVFTKTGDNTGATLEDYYYAVYPYVTASQNINTGKVTLDLPSTQKYAEKSFGLGANTMVAICPKPTEVSTEPMVLEFKNVAGYLRLNLYGDNVTVKSIELKGNGNEFLAGQANTTITADATPELTWVTGRASILLNCGDGVKLGSTAEEATEFWLVVPPTVFEQGFNIRVTDANGMVMKQSLDKKFEISRNIVETMEPLKVEFANADSDLILDVQFNEDGSAVDNGKYMMDVVAHPGAGMTTIKDEDYPYGNVVKFTNCDGMKNAQLTDSFYSIDYSNALGFKGDLSDEDGFTLEMVVKHAVYARSGEYPWQNAVSSNTFGLFLKGTDVSSNSGWLSSRNSDEDGVSSPFTDVANLRFSPYLHQYYHYTYVYDNANSKVVVYCNGEYMNEVAGVETIATGNRLAIGGYPTSINVIEHSFAGCVALVRMYDAAMTADQARSTYKELNIPSLAAPVGEPMFDAKFNADGTAENVGTADLTIETKANSSVLTTLEKGGQYVAKFHRASKDNSAHADGFYLTDYSADEEFLSMLKDGYTLEVLCRVNEYQGDFWSKVFSTTTTGIHHQGAYSVEAEAWAWGLYGNGTPDSWNSGNGWNNFRKNFLWGPKVSFSSYEHVVLAWDSESNVFTLYVNGKHTISFASHVEKNVGTMLAIGGIPYTNNTVYHPFVGEVAMARVYDQTMSINQVAERFAELQPTIEALNAAE